MKNNENHLDTFSVTAGTMSPDTRMRLKGSPPTLQGSNPPLSFEAFERRVEAEPDLELSWTYWNWLLPMTTGRALWYLFVWPCLRDIQWAAP